MDLEEDVLEEVVAIGWWHAGANEVPVHLGAVARDQLGEGGGVTAAVSLEQRPLRKRDDPRTFHARALHSSARSPAHHIVPAP